VVGGSRSPLNPAHGFDRPLAIPTTLHASLLARLDRLAPTREVAQIAAALGRRFSHELISAVATMPKRQLDDALTQLVHAELIFQRGTPPDAEYTFKHALVQDAAYGTLLRTRRNQLHARIAATLENQFPEIVVAQPALLARHCAEAGLMESAVVYWLKAAQQALARQAITEAVAQLRKGLDILAGLPDGSWRRQQELDLQIALGPALAGTKGWSAPDVGETFARARALAEQIDRSEYLPGLIMGQWAFHLVRSEHKLALSLAGQLKKIGEARNDVRAQLLGRRADGEARFYLGEFVVARALLDQCHGFADPAHRAVGVGRSVDHYALMLVHLAVTLTFLGSIDQARSRLNEAFSEARRLRHAHTLAEVLLCASFIESITRSPEMQQHLEELTSLSIEHDFPYYLGYATVYRGTSLSALGQAQEGLTLLTQGLTVLRATGTVIGTPSVLIGLAAAYGMTGQPVEGLNCLTEAAQIIETTEERYYEAELHRMRGDLLNAIGDQAVAEQSYGQALAVAERQSAKMFELRAATSLARFWRDRGKRAEARNLLAPVYGWFTEGFDTPDLKDAKVLLDQPV
jgi:predicted ATPase